jgi:hypothetical protein
LGLALLGLALAAARFGKNAGDGGGPGLARAQVLAEPRFEFHLFHIQKVLLWGWRLAVEASKRPRNNFKARWRRLFTVFTGKASRSAISEGCMSS